MERSRIAIPTVSQITTPAELLAGTLAAFGCVGRTSILTETPLSGIIKIGTKISIVIFTLDLSEQICVITRITDIQVLIILGR
jgi:hypothetical protein